jgi:hypothetical protein
MVCTLCDCTLVILCSTLINILYLFLLHFGVSSPCSFLHTLLSRYIHLLPIPGFFSQPQLPTLRPAKTPCPGSTFSCTFLHFTEHIHLLRVFIKKHNKSWKHLGRKPWCFPKALSMLNYKKYSTLLLSRKFDTL